MNTNTFTLDNSIDMVYPRPAQPAVGFLPLAPALHRAVRVVEEPQPAGMSGPVVTTRTLSTAVTSTLTITLAGRKVTTTIEQPTTTVRQLVLHRCFYKGAQPG